MCRGYGGRSEGLGGDGDIYWQERWEHGSPLETGSSSHGKLHWSSTVSAPGVGNARWELGAKMRRERPKDSLGSEQRQLVTRGPENNWAVG